MLNHELQKSERRCEDYTFFLGIVGTEAGIESVIVDSVRMELCLLAVSGSVSTIE